MGWIDNIADKLKPADQRAAAVAKAKSDTDKAKAEAREETERKEAEKTVKEIKFKRGGVVKKSNSFKW
jgi:ribosomal protein L12E/L44/L45/RPP1/RPP2